MPPSSAWRAALLVAAMAATTAAAAQRLDVVGDAVPHPLTSTPGDADRGRAIVGDRQVGLCLMCHTGPFPDTPSQGTFAPDLRGAGARWNAGQLRLRIADPRRLDPDSIMPSYYRTADAPRIGKAWQGRPVLDAQQVEDVVAYLVTLRP